MQSLTNKLTGKLIQMQVLAVEERELYDYGFWQGAVLLINLATIVIIGLIFDMLWQSIAFSAAYGVLRPYAGGYHARAQRNCYIFSVILIMAALCLLKWVSWATASCLVIMVLSGITVFAYIC